MTLWTVAHQAPLWDSPGKNTGAGCHALLQGDLPDPGTELTSLRSPALAGGFFTTSATCTPFTQLAGVGLLKGGGLVTHLCDGLGPIRRQKVSDFLSAKWARN